MRLHLVLASVLLTGYLYLQYRLSHVTIVAREPFLQVNGVAIHYEEHNPQLKNVAPTLIFSHGLLFSTEMWTEQIPFFQTQNFHIVAYDHRGQGKSEIPGAVEEIPLDLLFEDAVGLIETLEIKRVVWVGMSLGGMVGQRLAARRPDLVEKLVLLDSSAAGDLQPLWKSIQNNIFMRVVQLFGVNDLIVSNVMNQLFYLPAASDNQIQEWRTHLRKVRPSIYKAIQGGFNRPSMVHEIPHIQTPTLIIHGEKDASLTLNEAAELSEGIPNNILITIPDCGHSANMEKPQIINKLIRDFIKDENDGVSLSAVDHILYTVPNLEQGVNEIEQLLGIRPIIGGKHTQWGTHNAILSLGENLYLEIIAKDPSSSITGPRPLQLEAPLSTSRLATWCARSAVLEHKIHKGQHSGVDLGTVTSGSRNTTQGNLLQWSNTDFLKQSKPFSLIPFFVDWTKTPSELHPAKSGPKGCELVGLKAFHPQPEEIQKQLQGLSVSLPVEKADTPKLVAFIQTPAKGIVELS